jgi:L-lactate dehydrogenase complex protein LldG
VNARAEILERIGAALDPRPASPAAPTGYRQEGALGVEERVELFAVRVRDYQADLHHVAELDVAALVASLCSARGAHRLVVPRGLPDAWRSAELELVYDDDLSTGELDALDGALTGCTVAVAETGTLVLAAGSTEGRRALTLVPDLHVCVVLEHQIVELLTEALARIAAAGLERQPLTFISGPSATSDIELSRVEGVHGPRTLVVIVIKEEQ